MEAKQQALRLTLSYEGTAIRLDAIDRLESVSLPSDPLRDVENRVGFWYEVLDQQGRALYRRVIESPIRFSAEVRSDEPGRPLTRQPVQNPQGVFVLQVPYFEQAQALVLFSSPSEPSRVSEAAREIARFDLKPLPAGRQ